MSTAADRRAARRIRVSVDLTLTRSRGSEIHASTIDLAEHGARITTTRPLRVDELLTFHLDVPLPRGLGGRARVLREHPNHVYAVRFEQFESDGLESLSSLVTGNP